MTALSRTWDRLTLPGKALAILVPLLLVLTIGLVVTLVLFGPFLWQLVLDNLEIVRFVIASAILLVIFISALATTSGGQPCDLNKFTGLYGQPPNPGNGGNAVPNLIPLDQMNPAPKQISDRLLRRHALESARLNFRQVDACPEDTLNRILWHSIKGSSAPYPEWAVSLASDDDE